MINPLSDAAGFTAVEKNPSRKVLTMVESPRTAGSMPTWSGKAGIAVQGGMYAFQNRTDEKEFSFLDLLDMVNPLQHVPIIGSIYRAITGDEIRPIGKIVGGAIFGGPAGAAGGLASLIVAQEFGGKTSENRSALAAMNTVTNPVSITAETTAMLQTSSSEKTAEMPNAYDIY